jgi:hypothetical protein
MTISPVTFLTAPPIDPVRRLEGVRRRPKNPSRRAASADSGELGQQPMQAVQTADDLVSDETRDVLIGMRLGG